MSICKLILKNRGTTAQKRRSVQEKLLGNADHTLTEQQKRMLDANLSEKELQQAVYDLKDEITRNIWVYQLILQKTIGSLIKDRYTDFINCANQTTFSNSRKILRYHTFI